MSIIVKGMEMPKDRPQLLWVYPNGKTLTLQSEVDPWKELQAVPVPPHSRVIDADALADNWYYASAALRPDDVKKVVALDDIDRAPTIIEAEEGK